jgi:hypothetical protein
VILKNYKYTIFYNNQTRISDVKFENPDNRWQSEAIISQIIGYAIMFPLQLISCPLGRVGCGELGFANNQIKNAYFFIEAICVNL